MKRGTTRHPKTRELAAILKIPTWGAIGILESLWHFAAEFAHAGDIGRHTDESIAHYIGWEGAPSELIDGLKLSGWIEPCPCHRLRVHDWPDHADQTVQRVLQKRGQEFLHCYSKKDDGFVYLIQQGGKTGPLKIGWAVDPRARKDALQAGNSEPLALISVLAGSRSDEASIHAKFSNFALFGEWFRFDNQILAYFGVNASTDASLKLAKTSQPSPSPSPSPSPIPIASTPSPNADAVTPPPLQSVTGTNSKTDTNTKEPKKPDVPKPIPLPAGNRPSLEQAQEHWAKMAKLGCDYRPDEVRHCFSQFSANADPKTGDWMWGKRPVTDWREAMESRMYENRKRLETMIPGWKPKHVKASEALDMAVRNICGD